MLELGVVHVRLPGQQRQRLAIARNDVKLLLRHGRQVERVARGIVEAQPIELIARHREDVGNVELVRAAGLHADRSDQHEAIDPFRHLGGELGGDPSAERQSHDVGSPQRQAIQQFEIDVGDVIDAVEPVRQRRLAKAGMRRRDDAPAPREQVDEAHVGRDPGAAVQIKDRRAAPALEHLELDPGNRDHIGSCRFGRLGEDSQRSFRWSRPSPALGVSLRMQA